jgi:hypothetical protein
VHKHIIARLRFKFQKGILNENKNAITNTSDDHHINKRGFASLCSGHFACSGFSKRKFRKDHRLF